MIFRRRNKNMIGKLYSITAMLSFIIFSLVTFGASASEYGCEYLEKIIEEYRANSCNQSGCTEEFLEAAWNNIRGKGFVNCNQRYASRGSSGNNAQPQSSAKTAKAPYKDAVKCVTIDSKSNSLAHFIVNHCNVSIVVRWKDAGSCKTGCMSGAPAGGRSTITKIKGKYKLTACQGRSCSPKTF